MQCFSSFALNFILFFLIFIFAFLIFKVPRLDKPMVPDVANMSQGMFVCLSFVMRSSVCVRCGSCVRLSA